MLLDFRKTLNNAIDQELGQTSKSFQKLIQKLSGGLKQRKQTEINLEPSDEGNHWEKESGGQADR